MSGFNDSMIEEGFDDPSEYMEYLENLAIDSENEFEEDSYVIPSEELREEEIYEEDFEEEYEYKNEEESDDEM